MTPVGRFIRRLRRQKGSTQAEMAKALNFRRYDERKGLCYEWDGIDVSHLSKLERGAVNGINDMVFLDAVARYFWPDDVLSDEASRLFQLAADSRTTLSFKFQGASEAKIRFMNQFYRCHEDLSDEMCETLGVLLP